MTKELQRCGWAVNHKRIYRLMRKDNLLCLCRRKFVVTTDARFTAALQTTGFIGSQIAILYVGYVGFVSKVLEQDCAPRQDFGAAAHLRQSPSFALQPASRRQLGVFGSPTNGLTRTGGAKPLRIYSCFRAGEFQIERELVGA